MKLIGTLDSPYVRRTAISLHLYGAAFENLPLSVFKDLEAFSALSPVVKAPTLLLDDGTRLMDSTLIIDYFESLADVGHALMPQEVTRRAADVQLLGFILAASEKAVQHVYEHRLRPEEKRHQPWVERVTHQLLAACREWESLLAKRVPHDRVDQVAVTGTVVWSFIQHRLAQVVIAADFPHIQAFADRHEPLPAFRAWPLN
ncbi:glutathione S-transferase [uncultured Pluralibacter sp.]|uniref:glutathione S-transferase n=1 Tax=uncultured Pluralibacter sp. TaxID=1490864 RepID=UPI00262794B7|nr:glutathione S-transferase [uncultured Pluralibacter sp.]